MSRRNSSDCGNELSRSGDLGSQKLLSSSLSRTKSRISIPKPKISLRSKYSRKLYYLQNSSLAMYLTSREISQLASVFSIQKFAANALVYKQGDDADTIYIVGEGYLKLITDITSNLITEEDEAIAQEKIRHSMPTRSFSSKGIHSTQNSPKKKRHSTMNAQASQSGPTRALSAQRRILISNKFVGDILGQESVIISKNAEKIPNLRETKFKPRVGNLRAIVKSELLSVNVADLVRYVLKNDKLEFCKRVLIGLGCFLPSVLKNTTLFKDMRVNFDKYPVLWSMFRFIYLTEGEFLFEQGSIGKSMYIVYDGKMNLEIEGNIEDRSRTVDVEIYQGQTLGEISLVMDIPRAGSVSAKENSTLLELQFEEFNFLLENFPSIARKITEIARKYVSLNFRKYEIPFFAALTEDQYNLLGKLCTIVQIPPGEIIFDQGEYGDRFYMIVHGEVGIFVSKEEQPRIRKRKESIRNMEDSFRDVDFSDESEGQVEVCRIGPGRYFGELALVTDSPRCATARAVSKCIILSITRAKFDLFFESNPGALVDFQIKLAKYKITFEQIARHPRGLQFFKRHCKSEYSEENINFYLAANEFQKKFSGNEVDKEDMLRTAKEIYDRFVSESSDEQVNISWDMRRNLMNQIEEGKISSMLYSNALEVIVELISKDVFPRFKSSPLFQEFLKEMEAYDYVDAGTLVRNSATLTGNQAITSLKSSHSNESESEIDDGEED